MQKYLLPIAIAAICVQIAGAPASAQTCDKNFVPSSGDWDVAANWLENQVPDADDHVCIPTGKTAIVDVTNAVADSLDVDGTIQIDSGAKLTIDGSSTVDGAISLTGTLATTGALRIVGTGEITLIPDGNTPKIDTIFTLTLAAGMTIRGAGEIEGPFENDGVVRADGNAVDLSGRCFRG